MVAIAGAGTMQSRGKADQARMLKAVLLAVCLNAVLMLAVASLPKTPSSAGTEPGSSTLQVKLGTPIRTPGALAGEARAESAASAPLLATAPYDPSTVTEPLSDSPLPSAIKSAAEELASAQAGMNLDRRSADSPPESLLGGSASDGGRADAVGLGEAGGSGKTAVSGLSGAASRAELVRHIDALVRERLVYPPLARRRNIEGVVRLTLLIDEHGRLGGSTMIGGSGSPILDKAAKTLVEEIFPINLAGGLEEPVHISIMISYSLTS